MNRRFVIKRFSLSQEDKEDVKSGLKGASLVGGAVAVSKANKALGRSLKSSDLTASDSEKIKEELLKGAKKQGIRVIKEDAAENAAYTGASIGKK